MARSLPLPDHRAREHACMDEAAAAGTVRDLRLNLIPSCAAACRPARCIVRSIALFRDMS